MTEMTLEAPRLRAVTPSYERDKAAERRALDMQYMLIALRRRFQATLWGQAGITLLPPEDHYCPPDHPLVLRPLAQHVAAWCHTYRDMVINAIQIQVAIESAREN